MDDRRAMQMVAYKVTDLEAENSIGPVEITEEAAEQC
jgi:hypothetical protein